MDVESNPLGKSDDTTTRQNLNVSQDKGNEKEGNGQINDSEARFSVAEPEAMCGETEAQVMAEMMNGDG